MRSSVPTVQATLAARGIVASRAGRRILRGIDLTLAPGDRLGIIGPNGSGKSTLLAVLAGELGPDEGTVSVAPPDATVGLLAQEPDRRAGETGRAFLARRTGVAAASAELDAASAAFGSDDVDADGPVASRYDSALQRWLRLGGADLDARAGEVWASVGLRPDLLDSEMGHLSGGEAARASLAAVLLSGFDVLLLDEPTNDLDFAALDLLEAFVTGTRAATAVVSHDRDFLRRTTTAVLEIDEHTGGGRRFDGGWAAYLEERETARRHAEERYATYVGERDALAARSQRQRQWSQQGVAKVKRSGETDKFIKHFRTQSSEHVAAKAKQTERAIERLDVVDKPWEGWDLQLELPVADRSGDLVAELTGAVVERGGFRLGPVDLTVSWADRVGIVGPNGSGKSTLLALLLGRIPPSSGSARLGPGVVVGELAQARAGLAVDRPLLRAFQAASGIDEQQEARSLLAKFGLGADHVGRTTTELSPGERTRAELAVLMGRATNCLVLDEPTNHLDLPAIEQLEQALGTWPGTVLLVTHDREFLEHAGVGRTVTVDDGSVRELR